MNLTIGGGNFHQTGWHNLDYPFPARARKQRPELIDIPHNLMSEEPWPVKNGTYDCVYTEHCIEHLPYEVVRRLVGEAFRVLKPQGIFRVACPDAEWLWNAYGGDRLQDRVPRGWWKGSNGQTLLDAVCTPLVGKISDVELEQVFKARGRDGGFLWLESMFVHTLDRQGAKVGQHVSWWTYERMERLMAEYGFGNIEKSKPGGSRHESMRKKYLDHTAPTISLYVEGQKP